MTDLHDSTANGRNAYVDSSNGISFVNDGGLASGAYNFTGWAGRISMMDGQIPCGDDGGNNVFTMLAFARVPGAQTGQAGIGYIVATKQYTSDTSGTLSVQGLNNQCTVDGKHAQDPDPLSVDQWHGTAMTLNGTTMKLYTDGHEKAEHTGVTFEYKDSPYKFGNSAATTYRPFLGDLDEIRISQVPRSPDWIWAVHNNAINNATFHTYEIEVLGSSYFVTYDANGGYNAPLDATSYVENDTVTIPGPERMARYDDIFVNWTTEPAGGGTAYDPGNTFTMGAANITLYAQWEPVYILSVTDGTGDGVYVESTVVDILATIPAGYHFVSWTGDTANVANVNLADTTVTMPASAVDLTTNVEINPSIVTPNPGDNGSMDPPDPQPVKYNKTQVFTVTPDPGYRIDTVTGCDGNLDGDSYTTGAITSDCIVTAVFSLGGYFVTPLAGDNGSMSPATVQTVNHGLITVFTITPDDKYQIDSVIGCGGSLVENTYTTSAIKGDCSVSAAFAKDYFPWPMFLPAIIGVDKQ